MQFHRRIPAQHDPACPVVLNHPQTIPSPKIVVTLAADHLPSRLARLGRESHLVTANPPELAYHCQPHGTIGHPQGRCHSHAAVWRINTYMQVPYGFPDDSHWQPVDGDNAFFSIHSAA
jgi:hypothetical protein